MRLLVVRCLAFVVVRALMRARGNAGALYLTGAASSALTGGNRLSWSFCRRALGCAVLNDDAGSFVRAVSQSVALY